MTGRIVRSADFERVLGTPSRARSAHFAVHYLAVSPTQPKRPVKGASAVAAVPPVGSSTDPSTGSGELSTGDARNHPQLVDESPASAAPPIAAPQQPDVPSGSWLGYVVPKRHARRAVTRTLLKRQIRQVFGTEPVLPPGLWVVRLRLPFDRKQYPSASSDALRCAAREELQFLVRKVLQGPKAARQASQKPAAGAAPAAPSASAAVPSGASTGTA